MAVRQSARRALFDDLAAVGKALSSGRRLEILELLANGERNVESVAAETGLSIANTSQHLQVLRRAGLVATRRQGTYVHYRMISADAVGFWKSFCDFAQARAENPQPHARTSAAAAPERAYGEVITRAELAKALRSKSRLTVIDTRSPEEFEAGHLPGALSVPAGEIGRRATLLPKSHMIVAYSRGPFCTLADRAVERLARASYRARRLEGGMPEWVAEGRPVELKR